MHKVLGLNPDEDITDVYSSGKKLAQDLLDAIGDEKEIAGMINYAANINPADNIFDKAQKALKKL